MTLGAFRRSAAPPVALLCFVTHLFSMVPRNVLAAASEPEAAREQTPNVESSEDARPVEPKAAEAERPAPREVERAGLAAPTKAATRSARSAAFRAPAAFASAVSASAGAGSSDAPAESGGVSLPQGAAKIGGMGESFTALLSTGIGTYSVPLPLEKARGAAQPSLELTYGSSAGDGVVGLGWNIGVPYIARETKHGVPKYADPVGPWQPEQDRFVYNGAELVPLGTVKGGACAGAPAGEAFPVWAEGWQYFRPRAEGSFERFFWSPDHRTWRVQDQSGVSMELGVPLDGTGDENALERATQGDLTRIFRWNLARTYDVHGDGKPFEAAQPKPYNVVVYRYLHDGGIAYPADIYDTTPVANPAASALSEFAHHTHLEWEERPDTSTGYRRGYPVTQKLRLRRVDVTSKTFGGTGARRLVRRIHLAYNAASHASQLVSIQTEGRCATTEEAAPAENAQGLVAPTSCARLPATTFEYTRVRGADGKVLASPVPGFDGLDGTLRTIDGAPGLQFSGGYTNLVDINNDGLPDLLDTDASREGNAGKHQVWINGSTQAPGALSGPYPIDVPQVPSTRGASPNALDLSFLSWYTVPLDTDGDGQVNLTYVDSPMFEYAPVFLGNRGLWKGRLSNAPDKFLANILLGTNRPILRVFDANGDGLPDMVLGGNDDIATYFSLGRYPGGRGFFGTASRTGARTATLSPEPKRVCQLYNGYGIAVFSQGPVIADMNADGLPDVVILRAGGVDYWPNRGDGTFGTAPEDCTPPGIVQNFVEVPAPTYEAPADAYRLGDLNGDGYPDLYLRAFDTLKVWFNLNGTAFAPLPFEMSGLPNADPLFHETLVDWNGSGSTDLTISGAYNAYIDFLGGQRPGLLTRISNGYGKVEEIEYVSSTEEAASARAAGKPWSLPLVMHMVKRVTVRDSLEALGRTPAAMVTEYAYEDPVFETDTRDFRGFRRVTQKAIGDANSPTALTRTTFLLGECTEDASGVLCGSERVTGENPRSALAGRPALIEVSDAAGKYLRAEHTTYRLRKLADGLDGRDVRFAYARKTDTYLYDTAQPPTAPAPLTLTDVEVESVRGTIAAEPATYALPPGPGRVTVSRTALYDDAGHTTESEALGVTEGGPKDEVLRTRATYARAPGDTSGWLFRKTGVALSGAGHPNDARATTFVVDGHGRVVKTTSVLTGTVPLDRRHASGGAVAPSPANASRDGEVTLSTIDYDAFGNVTGTRGPTGQCASSTPDPVFAELRILDEARVGALGSDGCGITSLLTSGTFDRGLALTRTVTGARGEVSKAEYDAFGRVTATWAPSPTTLGQLAGAPSAKYEYLLPTPQKPYAATHVQTLDGDGPGYCDSWAFVDGLGRAIVSLAPAEATDPRPWIASGLVDYNAKGGVARAYQPFFTDATPASPPWKPSPGTRSMAKVYDAFGREVDTFAYDGKRRAHVDYHALARDDWDSGDLLTTEHAATYVTMVMDGHGRTVASIERYGAGGKQWRKLATSYLPSGEAAILTRSSSESTMSAVRWMRFDSLGRMVLNVEPNTTVGFSPDPTMSAASLRTLRYAYDDAGNLVGTSDARGCGINYHYDAAGRLLVEDYSPCDSSQPAYTAPDLRTGNGTEVFHHYDREEPEDADVRAAGCSGNPDALLGRKVSTISRGDKTVNGLDARGRPVCVARQVAKPGASPSNVAERFAPRWYVKTASFDLEDRPVTVTTGARVAALLGAGASSWVRHVYGKRGPPVRVESSYGDLITELSHDAQGKREHITYGDLAKTATDYTYDELDRLKTVQTYRGRPPLWSTASGGYQPPASSADPTLQLVLEDGEYVYDDADDLREIRDRRVASDWPAGAKPVTRAIKYDDLHRVTKVTYAYAAGDDTWVAPFAAENAGDDDDGRRAKPSPHVSFDKRVREETFAFDWLGNVATSGDDATGFFDRSLGTQTHGGAATPYQLRAASNRTTSVKTTSREGELAAAYDASGNLTALVVQRDAWKKEGTRLVSLCLPSGTTCSQRFAYAWDEAGRLLGARRWDLTPGEVMSSGTLDREPPARPADVELRYAYDGGGERVRKTAADDAGAERHTLYVFPSLELRRTAFRDLDYDDNERTETVYLLAEGKRLGRVFYGDEDLPTTTSGRRHVLLNLPDHLGSSSIVVDQDTSELVERSTYSAFGWAESDYRPQRWGAFREDYRFTGKEEDIEVGLQYFGKRYFAPALMRWVSPDPLALHAPGSEDLNLYAYVHGRVYTAVDPNGEFAFLLPLLVPIAIGAGIGAVTGGLGAIGMAAAKGVPITLGLVLSGVGSGIVGGAVGGALGPAGAALTLGTLAHAVGAGAAAGVLGGIAGRAIGAGFGLGSWGDVLNPGALLFDAALGGAIGGAGQAVRAGVQALRGPKAPVDSPPSQAPAGQGGPTGKPPVVEPPPVVEAEPLPHVTARPRALPSMELELAPPPPGATPPRPAPSLRPMPHPESLPPPVPQGIGQEQFAAAARAIRSQAGHLGDDVFVHGSRASGTARPTSDIDIGIRVSDERFAELVRSRFGSPNPGTAKFRTMMHALETGKLQAGEAGLRGLRRQLEGIFGMSVDISVIRAGGAFDRGPFIGVP